ncbi:MAG TPA: GNAT family N-acetyltransferase [Candidatus Binataceae bacterium]|nr:GNAT family N-acetyltransferase [Candidatus Binataceae bacterium]
MSAIEITTDRARMDVDAIRAFLARSYWANGIAREVVARAVANSLCFGAFAGAAQIGFVRVVTDCATFAYVADVYVLEAYRGRGISKALMAAVRAHPDLQGLRRWHLATRDAHGLYRQFGFTALENPDRHMESVDPEVYSRMGER